MSTVIDVYPSSAHVPTFKQFADTVQAVLIEHRADPHLAEIVGGVSDAELRPHIERVMEMPGGKHWARFDDETETLGFRGDDYGWLSFPVIEYAFDFYFDDDVNEFEDLPHTAVIAEYAERAALIGSLQGFPFEKTARIEHSWFLRMQAAQPLQTRILAGLRGSGARASHRGVPLLRRWRYRLRPRPGRPSHVPLLVPRVDYTRHARTVH